MRIIFVLLQMSMLVAGCSPGTKHIAYDIVIESDRVIMSGATISQESMLKKVRTDISEIGFQISVAITVSPTVDYRKMVLSLRPITQSSLCDYKIRIPQNPFIKITGFTCPINFAMAKEIDIIVLGNEVRVDEGTMQLEQLSDYLARESSANEDIRIFISAQPDATAEEFYNVLEIIQKMTVDVIWDVDGCRIEPPQPVYACPGGNSSSLFNRKSSTNSIQQCKRTRRCCDHR